jgi:hypothetical protein
MKSEKFILSNRSYLSNLLKMTIMSAMLTLWISDANAQCPLACNNLVQVSVDEDCNVEITPDMMLEGQGVPAQCSLVYKVVVLNANGTARTNPVVTGADIDKTLQVRVYAGANSCWGLIKVEDKLKPRVLCRPKLEVPCWDTNYEPTKQLPTLPLVSDNCQTGTRRVTKDEIVSDVTTEMPCSNRLRARRIVCYQVQDASKNLSDKCCDTIDYVGITLADIKFPKSFDGSPKNRPHISCEGTWPWGGRSYNPTTRRYETSWLTNKNGVVRTNIAVWDINGDGTVDLTSDGRPGISETGAPYVAHADNVIGYALGYMVSASPTGTATVPGCAANAKVGYDLANDVWQEDCDGESGMDTTIDTFYTPLVVGNSLCKINVTHSDTEIPICDNSYKILREWKVIEWCTGQIKSGYQIIKVVDDKGPEVTIPTDLTTPVTPCNSNFTVSSIIPTDPYSCTGTWIALEPIKIFDCTDSFYIKDNYTVQFALADANGNAPPTGSPFFFLKSGVESKKLLTGPNKGKWQITGLPLGCSWIKYTLKDRCNNITEAFTEVRVVDNTPPIAVCDEFTVVTLSTNGTARVFAETFDDGSHDNCSDVGFEVARMNSACPGDNFGTSDSNFKPYAEFCCEDITRLEVDINGDGVRDAGHIRVVLRVWDDANGDGKYNKDVFQGRRDNSNTCMVTIKVEDKTPPVITCPKDVTIECGADTSRLAHGTPVLSSTPLNTPYYLDNCPGARLTYTPGGTIDNCGQGEITHKFTVTAAGSTSTNKATTEASCTQRIRVRNTVFYNGPVLESTNPIIWKNLGPKPPIDGCASEVIDPSKTGFPDLGETSCSQVAHTYEDQRFNLLRMFVTRYYVSGQ